MHATNDDLAHTRQAFAKWRANRRGRTRIPPELWEKAVALLDHHRITHVARELHIHPTELRKRRLAALSHRPLVPSTSLAPQFLEVRPSGLSSKTGPPLTSPPAPPRLATEMALRLQIERADGHRLTLSMSSSEWSRLEALYSLFLRA